MASPPLRRRTVARTVGYTLFVSDGIEGGDGLRPADSSTVHPGSQIRRVSSADRIRRQRDTTHASAMYPVHDPPAAGTACNVGSSS